MMKKSSQSPEAEGHLLHRSLSAYHFAKDESSLFVKNTSINFMPSCPRVLPHPPFHYRNVEAFIRLIYHCMDRWHYSIACYTSGVITLDWPNEFIQTHRRKVAVPSSGNSRQP